MKEKLIDKSLKLHKVELKGQIVLNHLSLLSYVQWINIKIKNTRFFIQVHWASK